MVGSIDPRCETLRGTHWPVKVAGVFGTRVAENHLGQRSATASTGRTYGCKRSDQTVKKTLVARGLRSHPVHRHRKFRAVLDGLVDHAIALGEFEQQIEFVLRC